MAIPLSSSGYTKVGKDILDYLVNRSNSIGKFHIRHNLSEDIREIWMEGLREYTFISHMGELSCSELVALDEWADRMILKKINQTLDILESRIDDA